MSSRRDKYSMLKDEGKLHGTIARARKLRRQRDWQFTKTFLTFLDTPNRIIIPLGPIQTQAMRNRSRRLHPQRRRWEAPAANADIMSKGIGVVTIGRGRYSSRCRYSKCDYEPRTRSFAVITRKRMCWYISTQHEIWIAPKGWHFGKDCHPGTSAFRIYACRDAFAGDIALRWYFDSDDVYRGEDTFWRLARQHVASMQQSRRDRRDYARITSTVITVELIVPHKGVQTVIRIQRTGPMRVRYARDFVR
jgi:hypothetical protein